MTIIVTGGAGFIGSNFIFHMLEKYPDYRIICLDKLTYAGNLSTLAPVMDNPNFRFVKADICDREAVNKLFEEEHPDIVVNFAAESHVDRSIEDPGIFLQTNIIGTSVLMDACRKYGIQRYHQVSTDEVYGDLPLDRPDLFFTEETPIHTSSPYSSSKAAADLLVLAYHRTYGLPVTISRCSNNYGPYHFPEKLIPLMIANALADKPLPVYGEGLNVRDWLYVEDHCKAIATQGKDAMIKNLKEKRISAVFLVCVCGETYSYTTYESHAANCYIFAMKSGGNIPYTVEKNHWGHVFSTEEELVKGILDEKTLREEINTWKKNAAPGAAAYMDNDDILKQFSDKRKAVVDWKSEQISLEQRLKRAALNVIFKELRLKNKQ